MSRAPAPRPLHDRVAVITGVSRPNSIGFAVARRLGQMGAKLFLQGWSPADKSLAPNTPPMTSSIDAMLRDQGLDAAYGEFDLADAASPSAVIRAAVEACGHVDILDLNHAHSHGETIQTLDAASVDLHLAVNVRASLLLTQAFLEQHDGRPGGRIIVMLAGEHRNPMPFELPYAASKGALHTMVMSLTSQLAERGITINAIDPGPIDTGWASGDDRGVVLSRMPMGRWGEPDDAARLIGWLCTDDARWVTGQVIASDGGYRHL